MFRMLCVLYLQSVICGVDVIIFDLASSFCLLIGYCQVSDRLCDRYGEYFARVGGQVQAEPKNGPLFWCDVTLGETTLMASKHSTSAMF